MCLPKGETIIHYWNDYERYRSTQMIARVSAGET